MSAKPVICIGHHTISQLIAGKDVEIDAAIMIPAGDLCAPEPVAWLFEGDGWGREVMLSHQEALDRKERLSRTWDMITPLYAAPQPEPPK